MKIIDVTCAIIVRKQTVLACLRAEGSEHAHQWEFPGGKIEEGETAEECIVRELFEELNIKVKLGEQLKSVIQEYDKITIRLIPFLCDLTNGAPLAKEHSAIRWQPLAELDVLNWSKADRKIIELNRNKLE